MARDGEIGRTRWRTDKSCREQSDSVEEAGLSLHLSLGMLSKVVEVLSKIVGYLEVLVPVCDMRREGIIVFGEWWGRPNLLRGNRVRLVEPDLGVC
jgi:hypothetical protein